MSGESFLHPEEAQNTLQYKQGYYSRGLFIVWNSSSTTLDAYI